jgi:NAD(P)H dehydrogenase (quinone)
MALIVTTGSTGRLGGRIAHRLAAAGVRQRLVVRDPSRAPELAGAEVVQAEYGDAAAALAALRGADVVLMVSAAESRDRVDQHRTFIDAAAAAGVSHLVYTSFSGASPTATFTLARDHWVTEQYIRASGLTFTFLRDNLYADFLPLMVGDDDVIRGPAGDGRVAAVAQDDIADVAATILQAPDPHAGETYDLTGPESLTFGEIAAVLTAGLGRQVTYYNESIDEAYASRASFGVPEWIVDAWVSTYTSVAAGEVAAVSDAIPTIIGRPAMSLAEMLAGTSGSDQV